MFSLHLNCRIEEVDVVIAELHEQGTTGVLQEDLPGASCALQAFFDNEARADALTAQFAPYGARWQREDETDWTPVWQALWQPISVGDRLFLSPEWRRDSVPKGRLRLEMPAGLAFGTGIDATTRLALELMERNLRAGDSVLDLGTGSGILSAAAELLGAGRIVACDTDPEAVHAARAYFDKLGKRVLLLNGSARSIADNSTDLVVANINEAALTDLAPEVFRLLRPRGRAVFTGFEPCRTPVLLKAAEASGLRSVYGREREGWMCVVFSASGKGQI